MNDVLVWLAMGGAYLGLVLAIARLCSLSSAQAWDSDRLSEGLRQHSSQIDDLVERVDAVEFAQRWQAARSNSVGGPLP
jgi:hypothetical protein